MIYYLIVKKKNKSEIQINIITKICHRSGSEFFFFYLLYKTIVIRIKMEKHETNCIDIYA